MEPRGTDWKEVTIDISESTTLSAVCDLGRPFKKLAVLIPTIKSSTVTVTVSNKSDGTFYPVYTVNPTATGDNAQVTTAATTAHAVEFDIFGAQFVKILCGSAQDTSDKVFLVKGIDPV